MKKLTILLIAAAILHIESMGQAMGNNYRTALGVKFYPGGITLKHFIQPKKAVEGIAYFYNYGFRLTGLYEIHGDFNDLPGLKWYIGPGAHIGSWNDSWHRRYGYYDSRMSLGVDGVIGLDLKINKAPINLTIDWQPSFNLVGYTYFESGWGGLGVRYTFR